MPPKGKQDLSGYQYSAMSSLVINTDRSQIPRRDNEPTGEPETLVGRIDPKAMGSKVRREAVKDLDKKKKRFDAEEGTKNRGPRRAGPGAGGMGYTDILQATADLEGLRYQPRTQETREVYELILSIVNNSLGDQAQDVVRSAADTVLEILKDGNLKDFDKKKESEDILGPLSSEIFGQLVNLGKKITDYDPEDETGGDPDAEKREGGIDEETGVAVLFENEDEESDPEEEGFVVREESDDEEEGGEDAEEGAGARDEEMQDEALVIGSDSKGRSTQKGGQDGALSAHDIDPFWLQRLVSQHYPDAHESSEKTNSAMDILSSEANLRDCENSLMELFDYDKFEMVQTLTKNRELIVWCTRLGRADADEKVNVEVAMREKGVSWILKQLQGDRAKGGAIAGLTPMDLDNDAKERARKISSKATLAPGTTAQPRRGVDLEAMAFSQGGHLNTNAKVRLPEGSFKRSKKGYEEIHVPAPTAKPLDPSELVPISGLPHWAQPAFGSAERLNRIQSKCYPVAFGDDDPMLLCAPTGAGKVSLCLPRLITLRVYTYPHSRFVDQCGNAYNSQRDVQMERRRNWQL